MTRLIGMIVASLMVTTAILITSCAPVPRHRPMASDELWKTLTPDVSVEELKGLPIYPAIKEVLARDGKASC